MCRYDEIVHFRRIVHRSAPTRGRISRTNDRKRPQPARNNGRRSEAGSGWKKPRVLTLPSLRVRQNGTAPKLVESAASTRGKSVMSQRTHSTLGNTTNTAQTYPPLGQHPKSFSKSKSICVSTWRKSPWIRAIWTPQRGRKRGRLCFVKRKDKRYISNNRNFKQKNIAFLRQKRTSCKNKWTFSRFESCFLFFFSLLSGKSRSLSILATGGAPRTRRHAPERTRTGASRTQRLRISCLHPSPLHLTL